MSRNVSSWGTVVLKGFLAESPSLFMYKALYYNLVEEDVPINIRVNPHCTKRALRQISVQLLFIVIMLFSDVSLSEGAF